MTLCPSRLGVALVGLLLMFAAGCGKATSGMRGEETDEGRIREIDPVNRILVIRHRIPGENPNEVIRLYRTYRVAYDCRISTPNKPNAAMEDLQDDAEVDVWFERDGDTFVLYRIEPE